MPVLPTPGVSQPTRAYRRTLKSSSSSTTTTSSSKKSKSASASASMEGADGPTFQPSVSPTKRSKSSEKSGSTGSPARGSNPARRRPGNGRSSSGSGSDPSGAPGTPPASGPSSGHRRRVRSCLFASSPGVGDLRCTGSRSCVGSGFGRGTPSVACTGNNARDRSRPEGPKRLSCGAPDSCFGREWR